jgi:hypothetical protein
MIGREEQESHQRINDPHHLNKNPYKRRREAADIRSNSAASPRTKSGKGEAATENRSGIFSVIAE